MANLLIETLEVIEQSGHTVDDIIFIGSEETGHSCSWEKFVRLADQEYDNGYGSQNVAIDLSIVFSDGHRMWREEYDGKEWWEYTKPFKKPSKTFEIDELFTRGWETLSEINETEK